MILISLTVLDSERLQHVNTGSILLTPAQWEAVSRQRVGFDPLEWAKAAIEIDLEDCVSTMLEGGEQAEEVFPNGH